MKALKVSIFVIMTNISAIASAKVTRLPPEYSPAASIILSGGLQEYLADHFRSLSTDKNSVLTIQAAQKERVNIYRTIIANTTGSEKIIFIADPSPSPGDMEKSEQTFWIRNFGDLSNKINYYWPNNKTSDRSIDEWTRDFVGITIEDENGKTLLNLSGSRDKGLNAQLAHELQIDYKDFSPNGHAGGNIMSDSDGNCYVASAYYDQIEPTSKSPLLEFCTKIKVFKPLPQEGTQHIDIFAKIVDPNTVVMSLYDSNHIELSNQFSTYTLECEKNDTSNCTTKAVEVSQPDMQMVKNTDGSAISSTVAEIVQTLKQRYQSADIASPIKNSESITSWTEPDLISFSKFTKANFEKSGFRVIGIPTPAPYLIYTVVNYLNKQGRQFSQTIIPKLVFRTYTNSLILNGKVFIPQYPKTASVADKQALNIYRNLGLKVFPIDSEYSIQSGGSVHCLTMQIPR